MKERPPATALHISVLTVVKVVLVFFALYLVYRIYDILVMLFVSILLAALIDPFADWLQKRNVPRAIAVLVIYVLLFGVLALIAVTIIPPLLAELSSLVQNISQLWSQADSAFINVREFTSEYGVSENIARGLQSIEEGIYGAIGSILGTITGFFGGVLSFLVVLVLTFYMVVEENAARRWFRSIAPVEYQPYLSDVLGRVQQKIGLWLRGELVLMAVVGLFSYVGLLILDVDYALILALLAGLAEVIPYVGPVIAAIPAVLIAFTQSPLKALFVVVLYFAIQQLENNLLVPKIMQRAVGLNPIVSIVALLVGAKLGGVLGAILAIPIATAIAVVLQDFFKEKETENVGTGNA